MDVTVSHEGSRPEQQPFYNIYNNLRRAEWDTLMFFYGVIMCVGGLGAFGYLALGYFAGIGVHFLINGDLFRAM